MAMDLLRCTMNVKGYCALHNRINGRSPGRGTRGFLGSVWGNGDRGDACQARAYQHLPCP